MPGHKAFIDTNVLLYLLSADVQKADRAESILLSGGLISVQVLNELVNVAKGKLSMSWTEINEFLMLVRAMCGVEPLTEQTHDRGRQIAERYKISVYDAMIVAAALIGECDILYSEDMHDGLVVDGRLLVRNPFGNVSEQIET